MPYYAALISLLTNPPNAPPPSSASGEADPKEEEAGEKETVGRIVMTDLVRAFKKSVDERKWREIRLLVSLTGRKTSELEFGRTTLTISFRCCCVCRSTCSLTWSSPERSLFRVTSSCFKASFPSWTSSE